MKKKAKKKYIKVKEPVDSLGIPISLSPRPDLGGRK